MTGSFQSRSPSTWDCKYHLVLIPKRRRKAVCGNLRQPCGVIFHELARPDCMHDQRRTLAARPRSQLHLDPAEVCRLVGDRLPLKASRPLRLPGSAGVVSATRTGEHCWARGSCVSTVGYAEEKVRSSIREQAGNDAEGRF